jgi:hypothetical protein
MVHRCLTLVLLTAYLATQMALVPHAHEDSQDSPEARPHVHVSWLDGEHSHHAGHTHHASHTHHEDHAHHHGSDDEHAATPQPEPANQQDHESDAVYLSEETPTISSGPEFDAVSNLLAIATFSTVATIGPPELSTAWAKAYSSDKCSPACPLYLALRTLRI